MKGIVNQPKIMILDDDQIILKLLKQQLQVNGLLEIISCDNANMALTVIATEKKPIDLIFSDLNMPEMDGVEFLRNLSAQNYAGAIVLFSGEDERILSTVISLAKAQKLRMLGALRKPISNIALTSMLENYLASPDFDSLGSQRKTVKIYDAIELEYGIVNNEFVNYYQPKVDINSGALVGVESLVRWQHRYDGMVFPDQFIHLAEQSNLIDKLTDAVLDNALLDAVKWRRNKLDICISVNISMDNLTALDFPERVASKINHYDIPVSNLILEITESKLMKNLVATLDILSRLRLKRVRLSIDDFGTGHSSLVQLRDIPFDELKIDRSFVHRAYENKSIKAIFASSLRMAKELNMIVVAEGVEDRADWDFLSETGCDIAQGYYIASPMPADDILEWARNWQRKFHTS